MAEQDIYIVFYTLNENLNLDLSLQKDKLSLSLISLAFTGGKELAMK